MNEKINIAEILKDAPDGTKLWSPICGECTLFKTSSEAIICSLYDNYIAFDNKGHFMNYPHAECVLFPSKDNRNWETFKAPWMHKHFEPFQKVLVKSYDAENAKDVWTPSLYGCYVSESKKHCSVAGVWYKDNEILAYKGNENKIGKPVE